MRSLITTLLFLMALNYNLTLAHGQTCIYNDNKDILLLGSYTIEKVAYGMNIENYPRFKNIIYSIDLISEKPTILIKTNYPIISYEKSIKGYIAVSTRKKIKQVFEDKKDLTILDKDGNIVKKIDAVQILNDEHFFSWSPDGMRIVYVTGKTRIEGREPFYPDGVWIYDVEKDESKKLNIKGVKINWSRHDGKIYIQEDFNDTTKVSVYDPSSGKLSKSDKKGILFTDDGKYYFVSDLQEGLEYRVRKHFIYDNATNKPIYEFKREPLEWPGWGTFIRNSHRMLMWDFKGIYQIFDIDAKKVIRKSKSGLLGWNKDMTKVVVYEGGNKIHIDELLTGTRWQSIDIPK